MNYSRIFVFIFIATAVTLIQADLPKVRVHNKTEKDIFVALVRTTKDSRHKEIIHDGAPNAIVGMVNLAIAPIKSEGWVEFDGFKRDWKDKFDVTLWVSSDKTDLEKSLKHRKIMAGSHIQADDLNFGTAVVFHRNLNPRVRPFIPEEKISIDVSVASQYPVTKFTLGSDNTFPLVERRTIS